MITGPLVVVGDTLLDRDLIGSVTRLCPDAPVPVVEDITERARPGGAGLAALFAAQDGHDVVLITALAEDEAGRRTRGLLESAGIELITTTYTGETPEKVRVRTGGQSMLRLDYGSKPGTVGPCTPAMRRVLSQSAAVLVADYGRGVTAVPELRGTIAARVRSVPVVWDPHPRGSTPVGGVRLATPNLGEAERFSPRGSEGSGPTSRLHVAAGPWAATAANADRLREYWSAAAVAVTLGADGALLSRPDHPPLHIPSSPARGDTCGAGDRFAAAAAGSLMAGVSLPRAIAAAVAAASAYVAADGPASLEDPVSPDAFGTHAMEVR
jgi:D-beta-D-heptose 7-phosphate kinase/D-beta-D-heptose 1-phosphate adenosyltransferase